MTNSVPPRRHQQQIHQSAHTYIGRAVGSAAGNVETGGHVGAADCFDFFDLPEVRMRQELVEVADDLVEQLQALESLFVEVILRIETLCSAREALLVFPMIGVLCVYERLSHSLLRILTEPDRLSRSKLIV